MRTNINCYHPFLHWKECFDLLFLCSHKEADTCLVLHVADAAQKGFREVYVRTVNTDVMVLVIAMFDCFCPEELCSLWYWSYFAIDAILLLMLFCYFCLPY